MTHPTIAIWWRHMEVILSCRLTYMLPIVRLLRNIHTVSTVIAGLVTFRDRNAQSLALDAVYSFGTGVLGSVTNRDGCPL